MGDQALIAHGGRRFWVATRCGRSASCSGTSRVGCAPPAAAMASRFRCCSSAHRLALVSEHDGYVVPDAVEAAQPRVVQDAFSGRYSRACLSIGQASRSAAADPGSSVQRRPLRPWGRAGSGGAPPVARTRPAVSGRARQRQTGRAGGAAFAERRSA